MGTLLFYCASRRIGNRSEAHFYSLRKLIRAYNESNVSKRYFELARDLERRCCFGPESASIRQGRGTEEASSEARFASRAEEVSLDLVVRDKHGHPVRDLRPEEVEILDDGHPAKIRSLSLSGSLGTGTSAVDLPGQAPATAKPVHADPLKQVHLVSLLFETLDANSSKIGPRGRL